MTAPHTLLKENGFFAKKEFGQNFLTDPSSPEMIIRKAEIEKESNIIEIGPGLGAMTLAASKVAKSVYGIEKDLRLIPILENEIQKYDRKNIKIINSDILKTDIKPLLDKSTRNYLIGNLPYNISSQIIFMALEHSEKIEKCVFMLQKELAERIAAHKGSRDYGRISAVLQYHADIKNIATLGPNLFFPRPKVDSSVIEITFKKEISTPAIDVNLFHDIVRISFNQRRKTIRNSLGKGVSDKKILERILEKAQIPLSARPEEIESEKYVLIANLFHENKISINH